MKRGGIKNETLIAVTDIGFIIQQAIINKF